jgi:hypothetical protein
VGRESRIARILFISPQAITFYIVRYYTRQDSCPFVAQQQGFGELITCLNPDTTWNFTKL